ncbi:MAG: hypothetical protein Q9213_000749 [Squamulea squamosa]
MENPVSCHDSKGKHNLDRNECIPSPVAYPRFDDATVGNRYYAEADIIDTPNEEISAGDRRPGTTYFAWVQRTTKELEDEFASRQLEWESSSARRSLEDQMARILKTTHVDKVVAFAIGSLQSVSQEQRYRTNIQLAGLLTVLNCINNGRDDTSQHARCYIQEPYLSKNDRLILSKQGISVVDDPRRL